ncbi:hypothetical protein COV20_06375 [Candidatus Woesearchaeota archaeon CG10_big_fil_rev_8_21_14_0_10_45_16]|nr:MAG: hypothetical protein COV20_06375 [Candidatus Woesearchaeota archaeon CG10_big_fil_rev_8_21_14_0_10_45_16]
MRQIIEQTKTLEEAVRFLFNVEMDDQRALILEEQSMSGEVATTYDQIGSQARSATYQRITQDFIQRTQYRHGTILEVGCGSGLLTFALAEHTKDIVRGIDISPDMLTIAFKNLLSISPDNVRLARVDVAELPEYIKDVEYIVCRNALHRFKNPQQALKNMYKSLETKGKIYIRDLRRDADWKTIVKRIGEERWKHPALVRDYIGAMAGMFTIDELASTLNDLGFDFSISAGEYLGTKETGEGMKEFASEVEYVCVIRK